MQKKKLWIWISIIVAAALIIVFFIPQENEPSPNTRVILEHSFRTYIAPSCFEQAEATNFLEESTLQNAEDLNYPPNSACTEKSFQGNNDSLFIRLMKELGVMEKESEDW